MKKPSFPTFGARASFATLATTTAIAFTDDPSTNRLIVIGWIIGGIVDALVTVFVASRRRLAEAPDNPEDDEP